MVKNLVTEQQVYPLCEDEYVNTPLHRACAGGYLAVVEFLTSEMIKRRKKVFKELVSNLKNKWNRIPIHTAVVCGQLDIV